MLQTDVPELLHEMRTLVAQGGGGRWWHTLQKDTCVLQLLGLSTARETWVRENSADGEGTPSIFGELFRRTSTKSC
jgi:hypothetical protein